jgi:hypothetical protein
MKNPNKPKAKTASKTRRKAEPKPGKVATYDVGYRKPPVSTRFQKGKSGNPSGRPKNSDQPLDRGQILENIENEKMIVIENGKRKWISKTEIDVRQLVTKACQGNMTAARLLLKMDKEYCAPDPSAPRQDEFIGETEAKRRFGKNWPKKIEEMNAGNASVGRRKKEIEPVSIASLIHKILNEKVAVETVNGNVRMTNWEAIARSVQNSALNGDPRAGRLLSQMREQFLTKPRPPIKFISVLSDNELLY